MCTRNAAKEVSFFVVVVTSNSGRRMELSLTLLELQRGQAYEKILTITGSVFPSKPRRLLAALGGGQFYLTIFDTNQGVVRHNPRTCTTQFMGVLRSNVRGILRDNPTS